MVNILRLWKKKRGKGRASIKLSTLLSQLQLEKPFETKKMCGFMRQLEVLYVSD